MTRLSKLKIRCRRGKQYTSALQYEGGIIKYIRSYEMYYNLDQRPQVNNRKVAT